MDTSKRYLLQMLIRLGNLDGDFDEREKMAVKRVALANDIAEEEVEAMVAGPDEHGTGDLAALSYDEKFDTLYHLVLLMKADNQILNSEVLFIQKVAKGLGFQIGAIMELYPHVHFNMTVPETVKRLKKTLRKFLIEDAGGASV